MNEHIDEIDQDQMFGMKDIKNGFQTDQAKEYSDAQHEQSWKEAIKLNLKALGWCMSSESFLLHF